MSGGDEKSSDRRVWWTTSDDDDAVLLLYLRLTFYVFCMMVFLSLFSNSASV